MGLSAPSAAGSETFTYEGTATTQSVLLTGGRPKALWVANIDAGDGFAGFCVDLMAGAGLKIFDSGGGTTDLGTGGNVLNFTTTGFVLGNDAQFNKIGDTFVGTAWF